MTDRVQIGDWCTLHHADSTEIVDELRAGAPDAVIMDPPYGINVHSYGGIATGFLANTSKRARALKIVGDKMPPDVRPWLALAPDVIVWGADHLRVQLPAGGRFLAWDKLEGADPWDSFSDVEFAWHSRKAPAAIVSHKWKGLVRNKQSGEEAGRCHPMQKPIRVMEWCVDQCRLEPGALILDPYMGSGTTAIAAFKKRMKFVGVEIDRRWFDVATERINRLTGDGPLFEATE